MREIQLIQGSPEWHKFRENKIGASVAPVIMGVGFVTPYVQWQEMMGLLPPRPKTSAMQKGLDLEPRARELANEYTGQDHQPRVMLHASMDWHFSSFDGLTSDYRYAIEVKCPGWNDHQLARQGIIPLKYKPQLQHQMMDVPLLESVLYVSYFLHENGEEDIIYVPEMKDEEYQKSLLEKEKEFYRCVIEFTEPDKTDKDFNQNESKEFSDVMRKILEEQRLENYHKENKEEYRRQAIAMCSNRNTIGSGYKLTRSIRQGNVDYKAIPELSGVNLDQYRKGFIESWRVSYKGE